MKRSAICFGALAALSIFAAAASAQIKSGVDKLHILYCGESVTDDISRWSSGVNVGKSWVFSDNCYLIKHAQGWLLWDTGIADPIAAMPDGDRSNPRLTFRRSKTLASQLDELGVKPSDIKYVALSHRHLDHTGNLPLFSKSTLLVQKSEADWNAPFGGILTTTGEQSLVKLEGDHDVFGDGSLTLISTPGHTPGHQSLLVKLPKTGAILLSGDAVHFKDNWDNRRVPLVNSDKAKTQASMQRIADVLAKEKAQLWINHDKAQSDSQKMAPAYYD